MKEINMYDEEVVINGKNARALSRFSEEYGIEVEILASAWAMSLS